MQGKNRCDYCYSPAKLRCSACGIPFCSIEHQKLAWPSHRLVHASFQDSPCLYQPDLTKNELELYVKSGNSDFWKRMIANSYLASISTSEEGYTVATNKLNNAPALDRNAFITAARNKIASALALCDHTIIKIYSPFYAVSKLEEGIRELDPLLKRYATSSHKEFAQELFRIQQLTSLVEGDIDPKRAEYTHEVIKRMKNLMEKLRLEGVNMKIYNDCFEQSCKINSIFISYETGVIDLGEIVEVLKSLRIIAPTVSEIPDVD